MNLRGNFKGEQINLEIKKTFRGYLVQGTGINLKYKTNGMLQNRGEIVGACSDSELKPILLAILNN